MLSSPKLIPNLIILLLRVLSWSVCGYASLCKQIPLCVYTVKCLFIYAFVHILFIVCLSIWFWINSWDFDPFHSPSNSNFNIILQSIFLQLLGSPTQSLFLISSIEHLITLYVIVIVIPWTHFTTFCWSSLYLNLMKMIENWYTQILTKNHDWLKIRYFSYSLGLITFSNVVLLSLFLWCISISALSERICLKMSFAWLYGLHMHQNIAIRYVQNEIVLFGIKCHESELKNVSVWNSSNLKFWFRSDQM